MKYGLFEEEDKALRKNSKQRWKFFVDKELVHLKQEIAHGRKQLDELKSQIRDTRLTSTQSIHINTPSVTITTRADDDTDTQASSCLPSDKQFVFETIDGSKPPPAEEETSTFRSAWESPEKGTQCCSYEPMVANRKERIMSISAMFVYDNYSVEELRLADYEIAQRYHRKFLEFGLDRCAGKLPGTSLCSFKPLLDEEDLPRWPAVGSIFGKQRRPVAFQCITCSPQYSNKSVEELRLEDYILNGLLFTNTNLVKLETPNTFDGNPGEIFSTRIQERVVDLRKPWYTWPQLEPTAKWQDKMYSYFPKVKPGHCILFNHCKPHISASPVLESDDDQNLLKEKNRLQALHLKRSPFDSNSLQADSVAKIEEMVPVSHLKRNELVDNTYSPTCSVESSLDQVSNVRETNSQDGLSHVLKQSPECLDSSVNKETNKAEKHKVDKQYENLLGKVVTELHTFNHNFQTMNLRLSSFESTMEKIEAKISVLDSKLSTVDMFVTMERFDKKWEAFKPMLMTLEKLRSHNETMNSEKEDIPKGEEGGFEESILSVSGSSCYIPKVSFEQQTKSQQPNLNKESVSDFSSKVDVLSKQTLLSNTSTNSLNDLDTSFYVQNVSPVVGKEKENCKCYENSENSKASNKLEPNEADENGNSNAGISVDISSFVASVTHNENPDSNKSCDSVSNCQDHFLVLDENFSNSSCSEVADSTSPIKDIKASLDSLESRNSCCCFDKSECSNLERVSCDSTGLSMNQSELSSREPYSDSYQSKHSVINNPSGPLFTKKVVSVEDFGNEVSPKRLKVIFCQNEELCESTNSTEKAKTGILGIGDLDKNKEEIFFQTLRDNIDQDGGKDMQTSCSNNDFDAQLKIEEPTTHRVNAGESMKINTGEQKNEDSSSSDIESEYVIIQSKDMTEYTQNEKRRESDRFSSSFGKYFPDVTEYLDVKFERNRFEDKVSESGIESELNTTETEINPPPSSSCLNNDRSKPRPNDDSFSTFVSDFSTTQQSSPYEGSQK